MFLDAFSYVCPTGGLRYSIRSHCEIPGYYGSEDSVEIFRVVTPYIDVVGYECFGGPCCLHLQEQVSSSKTLVSYRKLQGVTIQKTSTHFEVIWKISHPGTCDVSLRLTGR